MSQKIQLKNGVSICYHQKRRKGNSPVFALHQITGYGLMWDFVASGLANEYHVIMPDMRGHGDSGKPERGYMAKNFAQDIIYLADELDFDNFSIISHSLGTRVGIHLAAEYPDRVSHLIAVGGVHKFSFSNDENVIEKVQKKTEQIENWIPHSPIEKARDFILSRKPKLPEFVIEHMLSYNMYESANQIFDWKWSKSAIISTLNLCTENLSEIAKRINCPVLMLLTEANKDTLPDAAPYINACFETVKWQMLPGKWEYVYMEAPDLVAQAIKNFLQP